MKSGICLLLVMFSVGCHIYSPKAPTVAQITTSPYDAMMAAYDGIPEGPSKITARNRIILRAKLAIDSNFNAWQQTFLIGQGYAQAGISIASLGLSEAATVTSLGTSHLLSLISAGIVGSGAIY